MGGGRRAQGRELKNSQWETAFRASSERPTQKVPLDLVDQRLQPAAGLTSELGDGFNHYFPVNSAFFSY